MFFDRCHDKRLIALADRRASLLAVSARQRHQLAHQWSAWQVALALPILSIPTWLALIVPPARVLTTVFWLRGIATRLLRQKLWQWWQRWQSVT